MTEHKPFQTGQKKCYDSFGEEMSCHGSGQDGESRFGLGWPEPRFETKGPTVIDKLTGLVWSKNANLYGFPVTWQDALNYIREMNERVELGHNDWRLPNRRELHSLMDYQTRKPSLPQNHPFENLFLGWYWTSTSAAINPAYAWYVHLEGARMFYGRKDQYYLFWPVRGAGKQLVQCTGQVKCYDEQGLEIICENSGQDGEYQHGVQPPSTRFLIDGERVVDQLTGVSWLKDADFIKKPVKWSEALVAVEKLNTAGVGNRKNWQLPNINVLDSLVDCSQHSPALPAEHPFVNVRNEYWSSTTSFFETDWAWVLYLTKGARGVGYKPESVFNVWPVSYSD